MARLKVKGATAEDYRYEAFVEAIEAIDGDFNWFSMGRLMPSRSNVPLLMRVMDDLVTAGLLRELDCREHRWYVRSDVPCAIREPVMNVYRCWSADGSLLYIGCTSKSVEDRCRAHGKVQPWWPEVADVTVQEVEGWSRGLEVERAAIAAEQPRYNYAHNPARPPREARVAAS